MPKKRKGKSNGLATARQLWHFAKKQLEKWFSFTFDLRWQVREIGEKHEKKVLLVLTRRIWTPSDRCPKAPSDESPKTPVLTDVQKNEAGRFAAHFRSYGIAVRNGFVSDREMKWELSLA